MKIQPINQTNVYPSFNAKLSPESLKVLSREVENTAEGNKILKTLLEKLKTVGNKETVVHFGDFYKAKEMVTMYYDEPDIEMEYSARLVTILNPLLPGVAHSYEKRNVSESLLSTLDSFNVYSSDFVNEEAKLFEKFAIMSDENPLLIFERISPFLKSNKASFAKIFDKAKSLSTRCLNKIAQDVNKKQVEVSNLKKSYNDFKSKSDSVIANTEKELSSETFLSERDAILNDYR